MKKTALALAVFGLSSVAWAQDIGSMEDLFPAMPCHDGWAACLVDGAEISPDAVRDSAGRPLPSDMRVGWFDLDATAAFDPFQGLSDYTGDLPAVASADGAVDALLEDGDPAVAALDPVDSAVEVASGDPSGDDPELEPSFEDPVVEPTTFDDPPDPHFGENPGGKGNTVVLTDDRNTTTSPGNGLDFTTRSQGLEVVEPGPGPKVGKATKKDDPLLKPVPEDVEDKDTEIETGGIVMVDPDVAKKDDPPPAACDNLVQLEPAALMGKLSSGQVACLEKRVLGTKTQTTKDKISRVLLSNAEGSGNRKEWERLMRRHLEEIDRSDPNLCFKYALHLSRGGVGRAWGVIKWSDYALENKTQWSGTTYKSRVYSLNQLKAEAAMKLWQDANDKLIEAGGDNRDALAANEEKLRGMSKDFAREWLDYARASGQDTKEPMSLCVSAAGSKKYCEDG